jgi:DNA-binding NtrC family response regulator
MLETEVFKLDGVIALVRPDERSAYNSWCREMVVELKPLEEVTAELRRRYLWLAIEVCGGNREEAAKILGISRTTLYRAIR